MWIDTDKYYVFTNGWWWGTNALFVLKDGTGTVEVQFDNNMPCTCYVKGLNVAEPYRRNGIGKRLLLLCEDIARQDGRHYLELSVEFYPEWLLGWYKRMGFHILHKDEHVYDMIKVLC